MHRTLIALVIVLRAGVAAAEPQLTHTNPFSPTGELAPPGHLYQTMSANVFFHELGLGLTDGLELRLACPGLPVPILGGDLELRASVLPRASRLRLVLGTGVAAEWINGADLWLGVSATAAWRGDGWSAHATARAWDHRFEGGDRLGLATAGVTADLGPALLYLDAGQVSWLHPGTCTDKHGDEAACLEQSAALGVMFGTWFEVRDMAMGLSALIVSAGDTVLPILPLLSMSWDRDL